MAVASTQEITQLLKAWGGGDEAALDELTRLCYQELRRIALQHMRREHPGRTLEASALVNEAFLRLTDWKNVESCWPRTSLEAHTPTPLTVVGPA